MSPKKMNALTAKRDAKRKQMHEIGDWLIANPKHKDFMSKVSERNDLSIQLEVLNQQVRGKWQPREVVAPTSISNY